MPAGLLPFSLPRRPLAGLVLLALACGSPPAPAPSPPPPPPTLTARTFELDNGLSVELVSGPCEGLVGVVLAHAAGSDHDPPGRSGLARMLAAVLRARAGEGHTIVLDRQLVLESFSVPAPSLGAALAAAAVGMASLAVTEEELALARSGVLAELAAHRGGDAALTAVSYVTEAVRPARGEGWTHGVADEVRAVSADELEAFAAAALGPAASRLVVVGAVDPAALRGQIVSAFAPLPRAAPPALREPNEAGVTGTLVFGDAPSALAIAVRAPPFADPLFPAFALLATRLARVPAAPRSWTARYEPIADPELLFVEARRDPLETPDAAATRVRNEMMALLAEPPTAADVAEAQARFGLLLGAGLLSPERCEASPLALAEVRARRAQFGLRDDTSASLSAVTAPQFEEARRRFSAERSPAIVAGGTIR